jgi:hypothetical protein
LRYASFEAVLQVSPYAPIPLGPLAHRRFNDKAWF